MKNHTLFAAALVAAALAGCSEKASVEGTTGARLTLSRPGTVTLHQGGMTKADVAIVRKDLTGEVTIRFTNLPKGVDVVDSDSRIVGDKATYTLRAGADAPLVENHSATVTASADPGNIAVSESVRIDVRAKE